MIKFNKFLTLLISVNIILFLWWVILLFNIFPKKYYDPGSLTANSESAIIVLTGGKGRIEKGVELFEDELGKYLFISGVFEESELEIKNALNLKLLNQSCCVILDKNARNTLENAKEERGWILRNSDIKKLILVSSYYHLPRSYLIFTNIIKNKSIIMMPVNENIKFDKNIIFHIKLVILEYFKVIYTLFFFL